jgi:hypothetical protein
MQGIDARWPAPRDGFGAIHHYQKRAVSMNVQLADVTVHIDETLGREERTRIESSLRAIDGVVSVHNPDDKPHLAVVGYNPDKTGSASILSAITAQGVHAELIGL